MYLISDGIFLNSKFLEFILLWLQFSSFKHKTFVVQHSPSQQIGKLEGQHEAPSEQHICCVFNLRGKKWEIFSLYKKFTLIELEIKNIITLADEGQQPPSSQQVPPSSQVEPSLHKTFAP